MVRCGHTTPNEEPRSRTPQLDLASPQPHSGYIHPKNVCRQNDPFRNGGDVKRVCSRAALPPTSGTSKLSAPGLLLNPCFRTCGPCFSVKLSASKEQPSHSQAFLLNFSSDSHACGVANSVLGSNSTVEHVSENSMQISSVWQHTKWYT